MANLESNDPSTKEKAEGDRRERGDNVSEVISNAEEERDRAEDRPRGRSSDRPKDA